MRLINPTKGRCGLCLKPAETDVATAISERHAHKPLLVCKDHAFILAGSEPAEEPVEATPVANHYAS